MPKVYTEENWDPSVVKPFKQDMRDLIARAVGLGWSLSMANQGGTLKAHDGHATIHVSRAPRGNSGPLRQLMLKVVRHADPVKLAIADGINSGSVETTSGNLEALAKYREREAELNETLEALPEGELERLAAQKTPPTPAEVHALVLKYHPKNQGAEPEEAPVAKATIVSQGPYMSHATKGSATSPGKVYESKSVIERKWSDGSVDYLCAFCEDKSSITVAGVNSHYKIHTNAGEVKKAGNFYRSGQSTLIADSAYTENHTTQSRVFNGRTPVEVVEVELPDYNPRLYRVAALAKELLAELALDDTNHEELAQRLAGRALGWVHAQQGLNGVPHEPKTAEEVLEAVRSLVDRGEYSKLKDAKEQAEAAAYEATQRAELSEEKALRRAEDIRTLRELVSGLGAD
jgi:hypothetical protein